MTLLLDLGPDLLVKVLCRLGLRELLALASTCREMRSLILERDDLWATKVEQRVGKKLGRLCHWNSLQSYAVLYQFLAKYAGLEGLWAGDIQPRGQLLRIEYEDGGLVGRRYLVDYHPHRAQQDVTASQLFKLEPTEMDGKLYVRCLWYTGDDEEQTEPGLQRVGSCTSADSIPADSALNVSGDIFRLTRPEFDDEPQEHLVEDTLLRFRQYVLRGRIPPESKPRCVEYRRIRTPQVVQPEDGEEVEEPPCVREGLYWALYGYHGPEIIEVCYEGDFIVGRKVTGDPNVPCGKVSFSVRRKGRAPSEVPPRILNVLSNLLDAPNREIKVIYDGTGRVASVSYRNPETIPAKMLQYQDGNFALLLSPYGLVLDFQPFTLPTVPLLSLG